MPEEQKPESLIDAAERKNRTEILSEYVMDVIPEGATPTYVQVKELYWPRKAVSDKVLECVEELFGQLIKTSKTPESLMRRIAMLRVHPNAKVMIWTEAFKRLFDTVRGKTQEEVVEETKGNYHAVRLEELA